MSAVEEMKISEVPVTEELVTTPAVKPNPKEELYSSKFAQIAKREREIQLKEKEVKAQSQEVERINSLKGNAKDKVADVLQAMGLSVDDVIAYQLSQFDKEEEKNSPDAKFKALEEKVNRFEQEKLEQISKAQKDAEELEQTQMDTVIADFKQQIDLLTKDNSAYELIAAQGKTNLVWEVIEQQFAENGQIMPIETAASLVEQHLEQEAIAIIAKSPKLKKHLQPEQEVKPSVTSAQQQQTKAAPTLSSSVVNSTTSKSSTKGLSESEKLARAAALLKWK